MDLILCRGLKRLQNMAINLLLIIHCDYFALHDMIVGIRPCWGLQGHPEQDALELGFWSFSSQRTLSVRGETAVSVVLYTRRLQGKPFDGGDERAVEGQTPSEVSGPLIEHLLTGQGARKRIQRILKLRRRRCGANSYVRRQGLQGCCHGHIEIDRRRPSRLRKAGWILSLASEREQ